MLKSEKADRVLRIAAYVLLAAAASVFLLSLIRYKPKPVFLEIAVYPALLWIVCRLVRGGYRTRPVYWLAAAFVIWYAVARLVIDDVFTRQPFYFLVELVLVYLFAFPFARATGDDKRLCVPDVLAMVYVPVITFISGLGLHTVFRGGIQNYFAGKHWCGVVGGRLTILSINPNVVSLFMVLAILLTVYLMLRYRRVWLWIVAAVTLLINYVVLAAMSSRAARLALTLAVLVAAGVMAAKRLKKDFRGRAPVIALVALAAAALCYFGYDLNTQLLNRVGSEWLGREYAAEPVENEMISLPEAERLSPVVLGNLSYGRVASVETAETLTESEAETAAEEQEADSAVGRSGIYRAFFMYLRDHPSVLLYGEDYLTVRLMTRYDSVGERQLHLHNAFFQTLAETGLPGLMMILALCVSLLVYSLRILFSPERTAAEKMLPVLLLALLVDALAESPLFVPYDEATNSFFNLMFFLFAGYVVELGQKSGKGMR